MNGGDGGVFRGRLSRDLICETAIEAIDEVGLEAVSMRMLAGILGVKASSLYHHFGSKDELMNGVAEYLYRKLGRPPEGVHWADQVKEAFMHLRHFVQVHPNAAPLLLRDMARSPVARNEADALLRLVCGAGADPVAGATLLSNLVALLVGHTLLAPWVGEETELGIDGGDGNGSDTQRVWLRDMFPTEQPVLSGPGETVVAVKTRPPALSLGDSVYSAGLDALLRGFALSQE